MKTEILNLISMLNRKSSRKNKKGKRKGAFGGKTKNWGFYTSLKVIPRSKRTEENSNICGIKKEKYLNEKEL